MATSAIPGFGSSTSTKSTTSNPKSQLKPADFIKMMITQLQHQDPMEPAKNEQLLAQMSQIGQLQASTDLSSSLKTMVMQNQLGAAASMIGKTVEGMDDQNATIHGVVNSIRVENDTVQLELDNGNSLSMARVTKIAPTAVAA